jgi:hypothetical protein
VIAHETANKAFGFVGLPAPFCADGILVMPPAEHALVGAGERGSGLHALVGRDAVKGVLVASAAAPQHALRPTANAFVNTKTF